MVDIVRPLTVDLLDASGAPALSSTSDMPVVETKPDAQNEGAPPAAPSPDSHPTSESSQEDSEGQVEGKTDSESATEPGDDEPPANDEPRKAKGVQKRLDELVKQREEAERRANAEKAEKLRLLALLEQSKQPQEPDHVEKTEPQRPTRTQFDDPDAYDEALIRYAEERAQWVAEQHIKTEREAIEQKLAQERANVEADAAMAKFRERESEFRTKTPDFEAVAQRDDVVVSLTMAQIIIESEMGPQLQYYLGAHPEEAARIHALPEAQQLREMGRIEGRLSAPTPPAPISAAPKPIKPIPAATEPEATDPENESMEAYAQRRRKQEGWADPMRRH